MERSDAALHFFNYDSVIISTAATPVLMLLSIPVALNTIVVIAQVAMLVGHLGGRMLMAAVTGVAIVITV